MVEQTGVDDVELDEVLCWAVTQAEAGLRVDKLLADRLPHTTRATVQRWIEDGRVTVNGGACRAKDRMREGAAIVVRPDLPPATLAEPDPSVVLDVCYEDADLLVVNKPAGLVVHPGRGHRQGTLVNGLLARPGFERGVSDPRDREGHNRPGIVHRIDKDTSGLLVVAKTPFARENLKAQLSDHSMGRTYVAITVGVPRVGMIESLHGRDPKNRLRFSSRVREGKRAVTHVAVLERLARDRAAYIECRLETGRTHQIRVHLSLERNTPLLGDDLYGGAKGAPEIVAAGTRLGRQALHAKTLSLLHPRTQQKLTFLAELPPDLELALSELRAL